jgi:hypothetical protein
MGEIISHEEIKFISLLSWQVELKKKNRNYYNLIMCSPTGTGQNRQFRFGILGLG